jgi:hypothetical protein
MPTRKMAGQRAQAPSWWAGTGPEWTLYASLHELGKVAERDFVYQGRNLPREGVAFRFMSPSDLAINVIGLMQTYATGVDNGPRDVISKQQMLGLGVHLIFVEDAALEQDPLYYVGEALNYRDHSHMGS